ncbi:hypothetical protein Clacol_005250 [Clathrus columnatus]|uniref:NADH-ubiquinone oxidoreductase 21kDa subunit N-terminal domain-containing protein n=1 Tax=Clathrus columnatus TaxID=1419009 RepID=A0AAV5ADE1_9AGAM|nr:hypothetical protein Clacol_005250 [Clathrus columnatus]
MLSKEIKTPYPLIDQDPHFTRVVRYFRPSDYATLAGATAAFPGAFMFLEWVDPTRTRGRRYLKAPLIMATTLGFWGWTENAREEAKDLAELSERAHQGKPLYGESNQPEWVQTIAAGNSTFSALKFAKYGVAPTKTEDS